MPEVSPPSVDARPPAKRERRMAALIHSTYLWASVVGPACFFLYYRNRSPRLRRESAVAFNFQVAMFALLAVAAFTSMTIWDAQPFAGFLLYMGTYVWVAATGAVATIRAWRRGAATYVLRLPLLRAAP